MITSWSTTLCSTRDWQALNAQLPQHLPEHPRISCPWSFLTVFRRSREEIRSLSGVPELDKVKVYCSVPKTFWVVMVQHFTIRADLLLGQMMLMKTIHGLDILWGLPDALILVIINRFFCLSPRIFSFWSFMGQNHFVDFEPKYPASHGLSWAVGSILFFSLPALWPPCVFSPRPCLYDLATTFQYN